MFFLMLDRRFKTFHLVSSFIDCGQGKAIVEKYDKKSLFSMFFKCYYHLHPLTEFEKDVIDQRFEKDNNLDIFEMTTSTSEPTMELINNFLKKIQTLSNGC